MKRFERGNGLDTALYKNYIYLFYDGELEAEVTHRVQSGWKNWKSVRSVE